MRQMLVSDNLTPVSRCVLLHILELHLLRWPSLLAERTGEWYTGILGQRVMVRRHTVSSSRSNGQLNKPREVSEENSFFECLSGSFACKDPLTE